MLEIELEVTALLEKGVALSEVAEGLATRLGLVLEAFGSLAEEFRILFGDVGILE